MSMNIQSMQSSYGTAPLAKAMANLVESLCNQGFTREEALKLTESVFKGLLN